LVKEALSSKQLRSWLPRYATAVASVIVATGVRELLDTELGNSFPFITYFPAVMVAAWAGGFGPSLLATALGALAADFFFMASRGRFGTESTADVLGVVLFLVFGIFIAALSHSMRRNQQIAEAAATALSESRNLFSTTLKSIGDAVISTDNGGLISFINPVAEAITGWDRKEALGKPIAEVFNIINEHTRMQVESPVAMVLREGKVVGLANHTILLSRDGRSIPIDDSGAPIINEGGRLIGVVLVFRDISERKRTEGALAFAARIVESSDDAIFGKTLEGQILSWNAGAERIYGYTSEEVIGKPVSMLAPPERHDEIPAILERIKRGEPVEHLETIRVRKDGTRINVSITVSPIHDRDGQVTGASTIARDISERRRAEQERARLLAVVESQRERVNNVVANVPGVVWEAWGQPDEASQRINFVSDYVERMVGYSVDEWLATPNFWLTIVHPEDRARAAQEAHQIFEGGKGGVSRFRWVRKDGEVITVEAHSVVTVDEAGRPLGMRGVTMDITERVRAERERDEFLLRERAARADAEAANRAKDEFLATVSHELRTPLNAILGWAHMLRTGKFEPALEARAMETIERNAKSQAQLIEDILDVSRIVTGKLRLDVHPIDLAPVIEQAIEAVRPAAEAKSIRLQPVLDPRAGPISGDPNRIQQVVWNLLSNAVKFTPRDGRVQVRLERVNSQVEIIVSDTGQGISPEFLPHAFDRFRQADGTSTRRHGGLGLGLAIVRHLVEMHGGTVQAQSPGEGLGATFTVKLPLIAVRQDARDSGRAHPALGRETLSESPSLAGLRVMIVDDEPDTREMLRIMIERLGAKVWPCSSASEAFDVLQTWQPDVLVSDIEMPGEDGYELMRRLRQWESTRGRQTPSVALTAYARVEDRVRVLEAGYQIHLAKPVDPAELAVVIATVAKSGRA
jgi:PAS domain S-box-containing protein